MKLLPSFSTAILFLALLNFDASAVEKIILEDNPLTTWERALLSFQRAGGLVGKGQYAEADKVLLASAKSLRAPYNKMALQFKDDLGNALLQSKAMNGYYRFGKLAKLCLRMHAHKESASFGKRARRASPGDHHGYGRSIAWCLVESGQIEEGLAEYKVRLAQVTASDWRSYYEKQIELIGQRPIRLKDSQFATTVILQRYLRGYETRNDYFGALLELKRILPLTKEKPSRLTLYNLALKSLSGLHDEKGHRAWEDRMLLEFAKDRDVCANILVSRGVRAHQAKRLDDALREFRRVCKDYALSKSYGMAQYNVGIVLKEQSRFDEAIKEFARILPSSVNDMDQGGHLMQAFRNYRQQACQRISECYEAKKEYTKALNYALTGRDKYKYRSWCGSCRQQSNDSLAKRIKQLKALINEDATQKPNKPD